MTVPMRCCTIPLQFAYWGSWIIYSHFPIILNGNRCRFLRWRMFLSANRCPLRRNMRYAKSVHLDVGSPDDLCPFLGFFPDELAEIRWRAREYHTAKLREPGLHPGVAKGSVDLKIEFPDDRRRCVPGRNESDPLARLETRNELAEGRNVRQRFSA